MNMESLKAVGASSVHVAVILGFCAAAKLLKNPSQFCHLFFAPVRFPFGRARRSARDSRHHLWSSLDHLRHLRKVLAKSVSRLACKRVKRVEATRRAARKHTFELRSRHEELTRRCATLEQCSDQPPSCVL